MDTDRLVASFYEAAWHPEGWSDALDQLRQVCDSNSAALVFGDAGQAHVASCVGTDPDAAPAWRNHYYQLDPMFRHGQSCGVGQWLNDWRMAGRHFDRTAYYNDFLRPFGMHASCSFILLKNHDGSWANISLHRRTDQGVFTFDDEARLAPLLGHLQRAVRMQLQSDNLRRRAEFLEASLATAQLASWRLDASGRVLDASPLAEGMVRERTIVGVVQGRLVLVSTQQAVLTQAIARATGPLPQPSWITLDGASLLSVVPVPAAGAGHRKDVLVTIRLRARRRAEEVLRTDYGLTRRECEVAMAVAQGLSPKLAAHKLELTVETVRYYLRIVFGKTGAHTQAKLSKLVAELT